MEVLIIPASSVFTNILDNDRQEFIVIFCIEYYLDGHATRRTDRPFHSDARTHLIKKVYITVSVLSSRFTDIVIEIVIHLFRSGFSSLA